MGPQIPPPQVKPHNSGLVRQPRYVDHNHAKTIKNVVNVNKASIKVVADENNLDCHLVSFTFDAVVDGRYYSNYFLNDASVCDFSIWVGLKFCFFMWWGGGVVVVCDLKCEFE